MDTTTSHGNILISTPAWNDLIEDISMIVNQGCNNFKPLPVDSWTALNFLPNPNHLEVTKVYMCQRTKTIRLEARAERSLFDICLGQIIDMRMLTNRILSDLICASRAYREDNITLPLVEL